jgi:hypothetical protein
MKKEIIDLLRNIADNLENEKFDFKDLDLTKFQINKGDLIVKIEQKKSVSN